MTRAWAASFRFLQFPAWWALFAFPSNNNVRDHDTNPKKIGSETGAAEGKGQVLEVLGYATNGKSNILTYLK